MILFFDQACDPFNIYIFFFICLVFWFIFTIFFVDYLHKFSFVYLCNSVITIPWFIGLQVF